MGLLDSLHRLLGNEIQGAKNIYHGVNPFDKQGFTPPVPPPPINRALPATPNRVPFFQNFNTPLQGSTSTLNVGSPDLRLPGPNPLHPFNFPYKGGMYRNFPYHQAYDLLEGSWSAYSDPRALPLKQPDLPLLPRIQ